MSLSPLLARALKFLWRRPCLQAQVKRGAEEKTPVFKLFATAIYSKPAVAMKSCLKLIDLIVIKRLIRTRNLYLRVGWYTILYTNTAHKEKKSTITRYSQILIYVHIHFMFHPYLSAMILSQVPTCLQFLQQINKGVISKVCDLFRTFIAHWMVL